ncbi:sulfur carrier protein ThiS [Aquimarina hainanensis]|uniref:Sulfur carrier protein ThiS n=1 Tax=Aquimarina hainanensis TaxID=1578017 RepID=A0ABW5N336_9FLAO|nr:sulfur carrier protein ThiS [Aquimarina sp. TRL1]QKX04465.1 sulfur carrier protein ThiS [Aquimarina sp. TRL1]
MTINVNNQQQKIEENSSVQTLLQLLQLSSQGIAVAINNTIVPKTDWETLLFKEGDNVIIIQATQGG